MHILLRTLGLCVSVCPPPSEQQRQVLATIWKNISALSIPEYYISCAEVWIQFTVQCFGVSFFNVNKKTANYIIIILRAAK